MGIITHWSTKYVVKAWCKSFQNDAPFIGYDRNGRRWFLYQVQTRYCRSGGIDWPEPHLRTIIIQDTSASFFRQIEEIKTALTGIVKSSIWVCDIDGVSPKDRNGRFTTDLMVAITNSSLQLLRQRFILLTMIT